MDASSFAGSPQVLISETRNHSPAKWAMATANLLVDFAHLAGPRKDAAMRLRDSVAQALEPYHTMNQVSARLASRYCADPHDHLIDRAVDAVLDVTDQSHWADHFQRSEIIQIMRQIIARHFQSSRALEFTKE